MEVIEPLPVKIHFSQNKDDGFDIFERYDFWDSPSTVEWFLRHGYTLYRRRNGAGTVPVHITENTIAEQYPYSYHDIETWSGAVATLYAAEHLAGKVVFAQDSQQRHVAIKLVHAESDEYRILRFLSQQSMDTLKENCLLPVLDLLPAEGFWLAVMPRWGINIDLPDFRSYGEILTIMHSMLKALKFLHQHNIIHRDIKQGNVLVNHFGDDINVAYNAVRWDLRYKGLLLYGLMDFDISIMLPRGVKKEEYRLPYQLSWWGSHNQPNDTAQGEFDYNPFAYDVGTLGIDFCRRYQRYTRDLPMLAPLLDRMTTRDIQRRFTAAEALHFFESRYVELTEATLAEMDYSLRDSYISEPYDTYDRWRDLPPDFAAKWASFREPPIPLATKILRSIVDTPWFPHYIIPWIRWFFYKLSSRICTHFVGLSKLSSV